MTAHECDWCHVPDDHPVVESTMELHGITDRAEALALARARCSAICENRASILDPLDVGAGSSGDAA